jgi:hypothetical protein
MESCRLEKGGPGYTSVADTRENRNYHLGSLKDREFPEYLR